MPNIDIQRIEDDLIELSKFGRRADQKGVFRQGFSDEDMAARIWLMGCMDEIGLASRMDGAGNVIGRWGDPHKPAVVVASHLDSVPAGGIFDGTLGVMAGLECIRTIKEHNIQLDYPVEIIATSEEEGRFGGMLGAQALTGNLTLEWLESAKDENGILLKDAMERHGLNYRDALHAQRRAEELRACIELHIEQGPVLDTSGNSIGVVSGISGVFKWMVSLIGKACHAGTAPMDMRSDAFMGLADFAHEIQRIIDEEGTDASRITIGHVELKPSFPHTVPGEVDFTIVGRDQDPEVMKALSNACRRVLSSIARRHGLKFEYQEMSWLAPKFCDQSVMNIIERNAKARGYAHQTMPSGAGHDAQFFTEITPTGMIFVPSVNGISHAPEEWTQWDDVRQGANLLLDCIVELARDQAEEAS